MVKRGALTSWQNLAFVALFLICAVFAYERSFWTDEIVRLKQSDMGLWLGLKSLFSEPSPFAPGEIILNWISRLLFGWLLPDELWTRIPSIGWVLGSLWLSFQIAQKRELRFLPIFVFFSVSLLTVSVQMRPYGSLIFAGALATELILEEDKNGERRTWQDPLTWFAIFFTHIYGICLIALACLLTQRLTRGITALVYTAFILALSKIEVAVPGPIPGFFKLALIVPFAVGNPHHASFLMAPLAALGAAAFLQKHATRPQGWKLIVLLVVSTISPILIDVAYRYFFAPRQVVAGIFPFLAFCSVGLSLVLDRLKGKTAKNLALAFTFLMTLMIPWTLSILFKQPPVSDQPMHRFREITEDLAHQHVRSILLLDPCNLGTLTHYFHRVLGTFPGKSVESDVEGIRVQKACWENGPCITSPVDLKYCWIKSTELMNDPIVRVMGREALKAEYVIHELPEFPRIPETASLQLIRAW